MGKPSHITAVGTMNNDASPTGTQPDYHAWKKAFVADRGREPTPYEAWVAGSENGAERAKKTTDHLLQAAAIYGEPVFHMPSKSARRP